ncbi:MAG: DUF362 domain-containing protein [Ignavibacteriaceae bacterium]
MSIKQNRRDFLKTGAFLSAGALIHLDLESYSKTVSNISSEKTDLSVVHGNDYYANTFKAVEMLGGMKKFVSKNASVGLLVNSRYNKPGTYVKPEITLAAVNMCLTAGAKEIISLENVTSSYWRLSSFSAKHSNVINKIRNAGGNYKKMKIPKAVSLKEAEVEKAFLDCDVFINIPIFKQHEGIRATGCLKNLMGLTSYDTNKYFHFGSNGSDWYSDVTFLAQCIADINLLRKTDLCIADATEYISTNGPFGPGNVVKAKKIVAGTDIVAVDSMGAKILGYKPSDILAVKFADKHGLGKMDLSGKNIKEIEA